MLLLLSFDSLFQWFYEVILRIDLFFCKVLGILYSFFDVFAGTAPVTYNGQEKPLIEVFFRDTSAMRIYSYMAAIGIALSFAFTIYAVIKKIFDIDDKVKSSLGGIIGNQLKCILFILLMNFVMAMVIQSSNRLMERIVYVFNNEPNLSTPKTKEFDNREYATMARIINTIGNYSVNTSYDSRYNINACYNEIRLDLLELEKSGVFKYSYDEEIDDEKKTVTNSWQYYITKIANAHDLKTEMNIDEYDEPLVKAITECMEQIWVNKNFLPIESYTSSVEPIQAEDTPFDALIFLAGTTNAAKNKKYNENPNIFDSLRYDYIKKGGKSIYNIKQVEEDFDISFSAFDHLAIIILGFILAKVFLSLCINCVARIFNLMLLYLIAPMFIAVTPLDEGEKTKQWSTAFLVQAFAVFGSIFGIRILMIFTTVTFNAKLVLFTDGTMNFFAKLIMIFAVAVTIEQASKIVTGILANNAGFQSIQASDMGSAGASRIIGTAKMAGGKALGMAGSVLEHSPLGTAKNAAASALSHTKLGGYLTGTGVGSKGYFDRKNEEAIKEKEKKAKEEAEKKKAEGEAESKDSAGATPKNNREVGGSSAEADEILGRRRAKTVSNAQTTSKYNLNNDGASGSTNSSNKTNSSNNASSKAKTERRATLPRKVK